MKRNIVIVYKRFGSTYVVWLNFGPRTCNYRDVHHCFKSNHYSKKFLSKRRYFASICCITFWFAFTIVYFHLQIVSSWVNPSICKIWCILRNNKCSNNNRNSELKIKNVERDKTNIIELPKLQVENFELVSKFEKLEL